MKTRIPWCALVIGYFCFAPNAHALFSSDDRGTTSAQFLKLNWGARPAALGEAYSSLGDEAGVIFWNPAALRQIPAHFSLSSDYSPYLDTIQFGSGAFALKRSSDSLGFAFQYLSYGAVDQTDVTGTSIGSFTPEDMAVQGAYARTIDLDGNSIDVGTNIKYIRSSLTTSAQTWAADFGLLFPKVLQGRLRNSLVVQNVGPGLKYRQTTNALPVRTRVGSAYYHNENWVWTGDAVFPSDNKPYVGLGGEARYPISPVSSFFGRIGINSRNMSEVPGFSGLSLGVGFAHQRFGVDYAFVPMGQLGMAHQWSFHFNF